VNLAQLKEMVEAKVHQRHLSRILYFSLVRVPVVQMKGTQVLFPHGTAFDKIDVLDFKP
jgi:hypothetical protein